MYIRHFVKKVKRSVKQRVNGRFSKDNFGVKWWELKRLEYAPRYWHTQSSLLGKKIELTDPFCYLRGYREIFLEQIYKFSVDKTCPLIIDCGANIGLSVIYFKYLYPEARIVAFEPDPEIFSVLQRNVRRFGFTDVELYQNAVWTSNGELAFRSTGAGDGRVMTEDQEKGLIRVPTVRLDDFMNQKIDFLKIDIEGAEYEVIKDCQNNLDAVNYFFIEYHGDRKEIQTLHEILRILQNAGFRYHIREANPILHPFIKKERQKRLYDLQLNLFGFRC